MLNRQVGVWFLPNYGWFSILDHRPAGEPQDPPAERRVSLKLSRLKFKLIVAALAIGQVIGLTVAMAPSASAVTGVLICLHNHPTACATVKNDNNVSGNPVVLYSQGGTDGRWIPISHLCSRIALTCFKLEDAQAPGLCLTATGAYGAPIQLKTCSDQGSWYNQGAYELGNGWYGESGDLDAQVVGANQPLYAVDSIDGGINLTWNAPGINM